MREKFSYDMKEVMQLAKERNITPSYAKRLIYQRAYQKKKDKVYYLAHRQERIKYFREYRKIVKHLRRTDG